MKLVKLNAWRTLKVLVSRLASKYVVAIQQVHRTYGTVLPTFGSDTSADVELHRLMKTLAPLLATVDVTTKPFSLGHPRIEILRRRLHFGATKLANRMDFLRLVLLVYCSASIWSIKHEDLVRSCQLQKRSYRRTSMTSLSSSSCSLRRRLPGEFNCSRESRSSSF